MGDLSLCALEVVAGFALFPDFAQEHVAKHLQAEALRILRLLVACDPGSKICTEWGYPLSACDLIESTRLYAADLCSRKENLFGEAFFEAHLQLVVRYADQLAVVHGADREIVTLAAWLHDLAAVRDSSAIAAHHRIGADMAQAFLVSHEYPPERIRQIMDCIVLHTTPLRESEGAMEACCLSNADAMAKIANPSYWLYYAFHINKRGYRDGMNWYLRLVETAWDAMMVSAKEIMEEEFLLVMALFACRKSL